MRQKPHPCACKKKVGKKEAQVYTHTRRLLSKPQLTVEGRMDSSGLTGNGTRKITGVPSQAASYTHLLYLNED